MDFNFFEQEVFEGLYAQVLLPNLTAMKKLKSAKFVRFNGGLRRREVCLML